MVVLFDGVCNFCNASINFLIDRDSKKQFKFAALQSDFGQGILKKYGLKQIEFDSIILEKDGKIYQKSDAALEIARLMDGGWKFFYIFKILPAFFRNFFYDLIAKNRYRLFGKTDTCRMPSSELRERFL